MPYTDRITSNLPDFTPPGMQIELVRLDRRHVQFRISRTGRGSFLLRGEDPGIFSFSINAKQIKKHFADCAVRYDEARRIY